MKRALITGITGQDGSYLAEMLLEKGYEVHGTVIPLPAEALERETQHIRPIVDRLVLHTTALEDEKAIQGVVESAQPDECYHLGGRSFVNCDVSEERAVLEINILGTQHVLGALRRFRPKCRVCFAASSEIFGTPDDTPQNERTPLRTRSVYGISKVAGYLLTRSCREAHGMYAANAILYNHESPRRAPKFVTRKISIGVARIVCGKQEKIQLGNLDGRRDWGFAGDYVRAMWMMLQQPEAGDYVIATGIAHTVRDYLKVAFGHVGLPYEKHVESVPDFYRPTSPKPLVGDAAKAHKVLGWKPTVDFKALAEMMVDADLKLEREKTEG